MTINRTVSFRFLAVIYDPYSIRTFYIQSFSSLRLQDCDSIYLYTRLNYVNPRLTLLITYHATSQDVPTQTHTHNFPRQFQFNLLEMHRDTYVSSPLTENTILAPNDNHLDGYEYFLFKFLSSLLVLFLFLMGFYFFLGHQETS